MESFTSPDSMVVFKDSRNPKGEISSVGSPAFLRSLRLRKATLSRLCDEVRDGKLNGVNSLFEPHELSVNPDFLRTLSGRLRIMRDIEIALNEIDDEDLLVEYILTEINRSTKD